MAFDSLQGHFIENDHHLDTYLPVAFAIQIAAADATIVSLVIRAFQSLAAPPTFSLVVS